MSREQFEQWAHENKWNIFKFPNGQYADEFVNGAGHACQYWQSNYKHLLGKYRATKQLQYSTSEHNSRLHRTLLFVKDHFWMNDLNKAMPRVYEEITECLGEQEPNHNTSCTYQFELAFHNLQDTPDLRKIYWSALGQLQFDSNDQVIPPELEECPCCKESNHV